MIKKLIASVLSLSLLFGSVSNLSSAEDKLDNTVNESHTDTIIECYADIVSSNPSMKVVLEEINKILSRPYFSLIAMIQKAEQLKAEAYSLRRYKEMLLKDVDPNDEETKKLIKNIRNRLQAIGYAQDYFFKYIDKKIKSLALLVLLASLCTGTIKVLCNWLD